MLPRQRKNGCIVFRIARRLADFSSKTPRTVNDARDLHFHSVAIDPPFGKKHCDYLRQLLMDTTN